MGPETLFTVYMSGQYRSEGTIPGKAATQSLDAAKSELIDSLREERITATGLQNGVGNQMAIPKGSWIDAKIYDDPVMVGPHDLFRSGATKWTNVKMPRANVFAIWPDPLDEALQSSKASCRHILTIEQFADRWHAEQSGSSIKADSLAVDLVRLAELGAFAFRAGSDGPKPENFDPRLGKIIATFDPFGEPVSPSAIRKWVSEAPKPRGNITAKRLVAARDISISLDGFIRWLGTKDAADWKQIRDLSHPTFLPFATNERSGSNTAKSTFPGQKRCQQWLVELMSGPKEHPKAEYLSQAKAKFDISNRSFNYAWANAITETGRAGWSKTGPVRKSDR